MNTSEKFRSIGAVLQAVTLTLIVSWLILTPPGVMVGLTRLQGIALGFFMTIPLLIGLAIASYLFSAWVARHQPV